MASFNELMALINAYIKQNGIQAITGQVLNGVLAQMVDQLGRGSQLMGMATPSDDPGTPDSPESWYATEAGTYTNFGGLTVAEGELALLSYDTGVWTKAVLFAGIQSVGATVDGNVGTPAVAVGYNNETGALTFDFSNMKGEPGVGVAAGFGTPTASVDANVGTPAVSVTASGPDTAKVFDFAFSNMKGDTGDAAGFGTPTASVDANVGTPSVTVSASGPDTAKAFDFAFSNLKGNTGDAAGFGTIDATIDANVGTPAVSVQTSGDNTAKNITFNFSNMKGETGTPGITSCVVTVDNTVGTPSAVASILNQVLTIAFSNLKGETGVGFDSVTTNEDGTLIITLTSGDTITVDLNHNHPAYYSKVAETSNPSGGFLPDVVYSLGTLTGTVAFTLAAAVTGNVNHYFWMFDTGSTAPTVTWPTGITWADGSAPTVAASKHYEVSVLGGVAYYSEV